MGDESGDSTGPARAEGKQHSPARKIKRANTKRKGELSEAAFLLKAASLGFGVAKPWGDSERYDFILDPHEKDSHDHASHGNASHEHDSHKNDSHENGSHDHAAGHRLWRVQLKCTEVVRARGYDIQPIYSIYGKGKMVYTADDIDVLIVHIIPLDAWYVLPVERFVPSKSLRFYPDGGCKRPRFEHYREAWHLLKLAKATTSIGPSTSSARADTGSYLLSFRGTSVPRNLLLHLWRGHSCPRQLGKSSTGRARLQPCRKARQMIRGFSP